MRRVIGVTFGPNERLHYLDPADESYAVGDAVVMPTDAGGEVAHCVWRSDAVEWGGPELPKALGPADLAAVARDERNRARRDEIRTVAGELIARQRLPMTVVGVDFLDDAEDAGRIAVIYFRAPHRVDFRSLVGELARTLRARVDLRQVGARDACSLIGGAGVCGRELCCRSSCPVTEPVSSRLSADQEAANGALQLAGACGRAKCCMTYEADAYADFASRAPAVGSVVATPGGEGVVSGHAMPTDSVWIRDADGTRSVPASDVRVLEEPPRPTRRGQRP